MQLICPVCRQSLALSTQGAECPEHGHYPKRGPALSFLREADQGFDQHWRDAAGEALPQAKLEVAQRFIEPLLKSDFAQILDLGCGDGVHLKVLREHFPRAGLIGLDLSLHALASAARHVTDWSALHADAAKVPLADNSVDASISFGVLAYMPDPWQGLAEMIRVTRPNGLIGVWFYPGRKGLLGYVFKLIRRTAASLPRWLQRRLADLIVPFLGVLPTASGVRLGRASWAACREIVLVNIAPKSLIFPSEQEIREQILALDCEIICNDLKHPHTLWARKRESVT